MRYYTWNGTELFRKIERAAIYAVDNDMNPYDLSVLVEGKVELAEDWEVNELLAYMRQYAVI